MNVKHALVEKHPEGFGAITKFTWTAGDEDGQHLDYVTLILIFFSHGRALYLQVGSDLPLQERSREG